MKRPVRQRAGLVLVLLLMAVLAIWILVGSGLLPNPFPSTGAPR